MAPRCVPRAVIPATAIGTNLLPATKAVPQALLPLVDRPLVQYAVEEALEAGIEEILIVTGRGQSAIADHFDHAPELEAELARNGARTAREAVERSAMQPGAVAYIRQQEPLGLGHALWCARYAVGDEPFAVLLPDHVFHARPPCLAQLLADYRPAGGSLAAVAPLTHDRAPRDDGLVAIRRGDRLIGARQWTAGDSAPRYTTVGRFILDPAFLERLQPAAAGDAVDLVEALVAAAADSELGGCAFAGRHFDCGDTLGLFEANLAFTLARPEFAAAARRLLAHQLERRETPAAAPARETSGLAVSA